MDREPVAVDAPTVVAVVVAHDPGDWFAETLAALKAQSYPKLRVLVLDAGSRRDLGRDLGAALPGAVVHRLDANAGYGAAANEVLDQPALIAGASFFLLCHDDVVPSPEATRALVDTALATGAGVVGPKLVDWDDPRRLRQVGHAVDKAGVTLPLVEPGELDQGQHDGEREVFAVPGGFTLVRADLFGRVGGFDEGISFLADDLSLCWRARLAGARVVVTSDAAVRHREGLGDRMSPARRQRLAARHRLRVVLTGYRWRTLLRILPQLMLWSLGVATTELLRFRLSEGRALVGAWGWNVWHAPSIHRARRHVCRFRQVSDRQVQQLQVPGLVHPSLLLQRTDLGSGARRRAVRDRVEAWGARWSHGGVAVLLVMATVLVLGSRHLVTRGIPAVGELASFGRPGDLVDQWWSTWRSTGLGADAAAPTAVGVLGGLGTALGGHDGLLRLVALVGMVPLGLVGMVRLLRPTGARWAPVVGAVAYAAVPVPYAALADGRWAPLAAYAAAPTLLAALARPSGAAGAAPVRRGDARNVASSVVTTGLAGGLLALVTPGAPLVVAFLAASLALGSLLAFDLRGAVRTVTTGLAGALVAVLLQLPWALDVVRAWPEHDWIAGPRVPTGMDPLATIGLGSGALSTATWTWGLLATAAVPVLVGRSWRSSWAVRAWTVAICGWALAAAPDPGWLRYLPDPAVLLACAGAALASAVGLGIAAIEHDVAGRSRRFGFRWSAVWIGGAGLVAATVPVLHASLDGYWHMPRGGFEEILAFADGAGRTREPARVLWLGDPQALPVPGRLVDETPDPLAVAVTEGLPDLGDRWPVPEQPGTDRIAEAARLVTTGQTARLGQLLAPMAVDYVVVPQRRAPSPLTDRQWPAPPQLVEALAGQLDLEQVEVDPAVLVFRNLVALPERSVGLDPEALARATPSELLRPGSSLGTAVSVLDQAARDGSWRGRVPAEATLVHAVQASHRWRLEVDGASVAPRTVFGWANGFEVGEDGQAVLRYETPTGYHVLLAGQALLWVAALLVAARLRRRADAVSAAAGHEVDPDVDTVAEEPSRRRTVWVKARRGDATESEHVLDEAPSDPSRVTQSSVRSRAAEAADPPPVVESVKVIGKRAVGSDTGGRG